MSAGQTPPRAAPSAFDAVTTPVTPGVSLVEASAGTGKTFGITMTVLRLLLAERESGVPVVDGIGSILIVTFTQAATSELVSRVRLILREALDVATSRITPTTPTQRVIAQIDGIHGAAAVQRLQAGLAAIDTLSIFTIHGFCKRILDEFALESGTPFGATMLTDDALLLQGAFEDWWRRTMYDDVMFAALAVQQKLTPESFRSDYLAWRNLPHARLEPSADLGETRGAVLGAIARLREVWDAPAVLAWLDGTTWTKKGGMHDAAYRARLVEQGTAAASGDLGAAAEVAATLSVEALQGCAGKRSKVEKAVHASIPELPFAQCCSALAVALGALSQSLRVSCLTAVFASLAREKTRQNLLGFDDLLVRLRLALEAEGSDGMLASLIRRKYQAALIDEFQDTDPNQFPIFRIAFHGCPLFLVGDPKQAIYGFRGADVFAYIEAAASADRAFTLHRNFRSTASLVAGVNAVFEQAPDAFLLPEIPFTPAQAQGRNPLPSLLDDGRESVHWFFAPPAAEQGRLAPLTTGRARRIMLEACVNEIVALLDRGLPPGSIAILVRANYEGLEVERLLRAAGVPAVVTGLGHILHSTECAELHALLRAIAAPRDTGALRAALASDLWGASLDELRHWASEEGEAAWEGVVAAVAALGDLWSARGFMPMLQQLLVQRDVLHRFLGYTDGERRLTNLRHIVELLHQASGAGSLNVDGLLHWLAVARSDSTRESDITELRLETDSAAVQIVSVHRSKGLEYDVVFCPTLWSTRVAGAGDPVIAHLDDGIVFDHGSPLRAERAAVADAERLAEDLRLVYVALTRARHRTYIGWAPVANRTTGASSARSALAYLLRDPALTSGMTPVQATAATATAMSASIEQWEARLREFVHQHRATMSVQLVPSGASRRWTPPTVATSALTARGPLPSATQLETWRITSFTALASGGGHGAASSRDRDDQIAPATPASPDRGSFAAFPAGRRAGVVLHELFEFARFAASADELRAPVAATLVRHRMADSADDPRVDAVVGMMAAVLSSPIGESGMQLCDVPYDRTLREWEFLLPLGTVDRGTFARLFRDFGGETGRVYAPILDQLNPSRVFGFLGGFVDLVLEHEGRWYVVDWKSNQLGTDPAAYEHTALAGVMHAEHYTLQYHLYVTALHRYLRARVPGYSYATHMGGAAYAFLRGFGIAGSGWFVDRPPEALIDALDALCEAGRLQPAGQAT